jgi:hypothetical protein
MRTDLEARVVRDLEARQKDARHRKGRYLAGTALYAYFEGQEFAFRDLALSIRQGDYDAIRQEVTQ